MLMNKIVGLELNRNGFVGNNSIFQKNRKRNKRIKSPNPIIENIFKSTHFQIIVILSMSKGQINSHVLISPISGDRGF